MTRVLAIVNNHISLNMLLADLSAQGISLSETCIIATRIIDIPNGFDEVLEYPGNPEKGIFGQRRFISFYKNAARLVLAKLEEETLENIYVVNNDNLLCNHILNTAEIHGREITVVAEGLMNFLDAGIHNLDSWRLLAKPVISRYLHLNYSTPEGHQSGAFHPKVHRVVSFSKNGLRAPEEKIVLREWPIISRGNTQPIPDVALIVHTALSRLMSKRQYRIFAERYADWIRAQNFQKLYTKRHPRNSDPLFDSLLPENEVLDDPRPIEEIAGDISASVIIGPGTTPLVTLKLMRPELRCIDFGADYYVPKVYKGGDGATPLFKAVGVESIPFASKDNEWL